MSQSPRKFVISQSTFIRSNIIIDEDIYLQVFYNIISNSVKYTFHGEIKVIVTNENNMLTTQIADTGIGITEEKQQHIYKMFSNATSIDITGIGIGLYLSKQLLDFLHGDLCMVSQINKGTDIMFWIPIKYSENVESIAPLKNSLQFIIPADASTCSINNVVVADKAGVLIVDDNPLCASVLKSLLSKVGNFNIFSAYNGRQAIDLYKEKNGLIKLVLMDINMPVLNGIDSCKEMLYLQKQNNWQSIQVIAVSAQDDFFYIAEAQKAGMNTYLKKPVTLYALQTLIGELKL